jgi:ubiquinol-cytochrome c reductase cytochrome c1 subunit
MSAMPRTRSLVRQAPPDLSLIARSGAGLPVLLPEGLLCRQDAPWGVNNLYLPSAAMPHVLQNLQGLQKPVFKNEPDEHGSARMVLTGVESMTPGAMKPEEYDQFVRDIANFLDYAVSPSRRSANPWAFS